LIGEKIKEVRNTLGLSQKQLAGDDMTRAYISIIEKGRAKPSTKTLEIIARKLGKSAEFFLSEDVEESIEISDALLQRAKLMKDSGNLVSSYKIANNIFSITQEKYILAEVYLLILEVKLLEKDYEMVLVKGEDALPILMELKDRSYLVNYYLMVGNALFNIEDYTMAKKAYKNSLKYSDQLKKLQIERIKALIYLGTTYIRLGEYDASIETFTEAESYASLYDDLKLRAEISLGLGRVYYLIGNIDLGVKSTKEAVGYYEKLDDDSKILALHNLAFMESHKNNKEKAIKILIYCLEFYSTSDKYQKQAAVLEDLAILYLEIDNLSKSKEYTNLAIKVLDKEEYGILRGRLYRLMGVLMRSEGSFDQAYYFLRMSYDLLIRIKSADEASFSLELLQVTEDQDSKNIFLNYMRPVK
jgi:transcriptional regulator with XRE-family HTH domain